MDRRFALDSNILIYCHRQIYPFEMAPAFWRQLIENGGQKIIFLDKVKDEIYRNEDQLSIWLKENEDHFLTIEAGDSSVISCYSDIITSVKKIPNIKKLQKMNLPVLRIHGCVRMEWRMVTYL